MKQVLPDEPPTLSARSGRWEWLGKRSSDLTGFIERIVFTALVFGQPESAILAMGGWIGLKMAATWNRDIPVHEFKVRVREHENKLFWASHAFLSLQTGFVSMAFAGAGGALARLVVGLNVVAP